MKILEIACDSVSSAYYAQDGGADRIELCDNLAQGGITPSAGKIKLAKRLLHIPIFVLIRPRKGDFFYNTLEAETMLEDVSIAKSMGADGIVAGALRHDGTLDEMLLQQLKMAASPLPFTFHRAFDVCKAPEKVLEQLIDMQVERVLTSGQQSSAIVGKNNIQRLLQQAQQRIQIIAGGGIRPHNIGELVSIPELQEFHSSAKQVVLSQMEFRGHVAMGKEAAAEEFQWEQVDSALVKQMKIQL
ncbi:MAG: copper homeostasis protein CutC [Saprospiraceae bacterium]|nr:copper homeostasis protein CutC [Saprospiraceae bacterium]